MKTNKLLLLLLILAVSFSSYGQNPFTEMLNDPETRAIIDVDIASRDQVIFDDLIVNGSACIGLDCNNGESFGFDTFRMKENNLRMNFVDTSVSASFPTNDWRFIFNDSSNGGANYFAVEDSNTSRQIFRVEAGAPANALYVDNGGRIGVGTDQPVVEIHNKSGDSPTLRLEQDGSSGFTPQTWDMAGNETNFFIRDATNGSKLPFRIRPGADSNSLYIDTDGDVGLGSASPDSKLDVNGVITTGADAETGGVNVVTGDINVTAGNSNITAGDVNVIGGDVIIGTASGQPKGRLFLKQITDRDDRGMVIEGSVSGRGFLYVENSNLNFSAGSSGQNDITFNPGGSGNVGIGVASPTTKLDVDGVITTPGGNSDEWNAGTLVGLNTKREMAALQDQVDELMARMEAMESCGCYTEEVQEKRAVGDDANVATDRAYLSQNIPNPFDNTTNISYFVPFVNSSANIVISNAAGQILENRSVDKFGKGSIIVSKARMSTGVYFYTLYADGKKIDTKRMVVE